MKSVAKGRLSEHPVENKYGLFSVLKKEAVFSSELPVIISQPNRYHNIHE